MFVLAALLLLGYMIVRISQGSLFPGSDYSIYINLDSALGLSRNTPVQIAGVDIGTVGDITLLKTAKARVELRIDKDVKISREALGMVRATGLLGDAIVEIRQPSEFTDALLAGETIGKSELQGDFSSVTGQFGSVADDVKQITATMKKFMAGDDSSFAKTLQNIEKITQTLSSVTTQNEKNITAIVTNLKLLSENMSLLVQRNMGNVNNTLTNLNAITGKVSRGEGTVGRLLNDDETLEKIHSSLDNLNQLLGSTNKLKVDFGLHGEYLGGTGSFKNYVSLYLRPRPDKYFLFEVASDPDPSFSNTIEQTTIDTGGNSSTFTTTRRTKQSDSFVFSAQLAKKFHDFTIRGGLIESTGGVGLDYNKGPFGVQFSAYDFRTQYGDKPHLKAMGTLNITDNIFFLAGIDDFINPNQDLDWFLGAGLVFTDDDIKSIMGLVSASQIR